MKSRFWVAKTLINTVYRVKVISFRGHFVQSHLFQSMVSSFHKIVSSFHEIVRSFHFKSYGNAKKTCLPDESVSVT